MKKYIIIALSALAAGMACSKVETADIQREINFEVANRLQTKAETGSVYNNGAFGTYAWFTAGTPGSDHAAFMVNEKVNLTGVGGVWKTVDNTFYWPKTGSIDFISYSPFAGTSNTPGSVPAITQNTITYTDVLIADTDLLYADKVNCSSNVNEISDNASPESGYTGVPTLFRHALAKVSFRMQPTFITHTQDGHTTTWDITVKSIKVGGFYTEGSCALALNSDNKHWNLPEGEVWTPKAASAQTADQELLAAPHTFVAADVTTPVNLSALTNAYVMPQTLAAGVQTLKIEVDIRTHLSNGKTIDETYTATHDLYDLSSLKLIQMNKNVVYTLRFKPTANVSDINTPEDVEITFDPAIADWVSVNVPTTIDI